MPQNKTVRWVISLFFSLLEFRFLCDLGDLCGKNVFKILLFESGLGAKSEEKNALTLSSRLFALRFFRLLEGDGRVRLVLDLGGREPR